MAVRQTEKVEQASKRLGRGEVFGIGSYTATSNHDSGGTLRTVIGRDFVEHHEIEPGDQVNAWIDSSTGALIILPESEHE